MKKLTLTFLFLILVVSIKAQDIETIIENKAQIEVEARKTEMLKYDKIKACETLYLQYMQASSIDSTSSVLKYWETLSPKSEHLFIAKLLFDIDTNNFDENIFEGENMNYLYPLSDQGFYNQYPTYCFIMPTQSNFNDSIKPLANKIASKYPEESLEHLVALYYGGNETKLFEALSNSDGILKARTEEKIKEAQNLSEMHFSFILGTWIPTGKLNVLGVHPEFGFSGGLKHKKMNYDFAILFRVGKSANSYNYWGHDKELLTTKHFSGGYIGFDLGRDILIKKRHELQAIGGVAVDFIEVQKKNKKQDIKSIEAASLNLNIGLGYRFYFSSGHYLGLKAKYNFVNYARNKHFDYKGDAISIQIAWGFLSSDWKKERLNSLGKKFRE